MSSCDTTLNSAKTLAIAAAAAFGAAPPSVLVAIALNGGFFTAPGAPVPMVVAGAAAVAAGALLKSAYDKLQAWVLNGCLSKECEGKFYNISNAIAAAITTIGLLAAACFAVAAIAWIPWFTQPAMWAVYIPMGLAAVSLTALAAYWGPLSECQVAIASARGPLRAGEKASDPWFLRVKPKDADSYTRVTQATDMGDHLSHSEWLECRLLSVREWEVGATAYIVGSPIPPVIFSWTFAGQTVPATSVQSSGNESTLVLTSPPLDSTAILAVTAVDNSGFKRTLETGIDLPNNSISCTVILHFVPPLHPTVPTSGPGPVEIAAQMEQRLTSFRREMKIAEIQ